MAAHAVGGVPGLVYAGTILVEVSDGESGSLIILNAVFEECKAKRCWRS